tara:strand:- start:376 stop:801 length:426 start_codon:yes stop_codon:yes gene_type:complete
MKIFFIKKIKPIFFLIIITLTVLTFFKTPYNLYSVLVWDYEQRMEQNYGFCKNESWGFYNYVLKKFNLKKEEINIINDEKYTTPERLFNQIKSNSKSAKYFMLLNFQSFNEQNIFNGKYDYLNNYKIKYRFNNCYLFELND